MPVECWRRRWCLNVILIGPVSGDINRAKRVFALAERLCIETNHLVVHNPMRDHVGGRTEAEYMQESLSHICQLVIEGTPNLMAIVLPQWFKSKGSRTESLLCEKLDIPVVSTGAIGVENRDKIVNEYNRKGGEYDGLQTNAEGR